MGHMTFGLSFGVQKALQERRHRVRRLPYRCLGGRWHMSEVVPEVLLPLVLSSRVASRWSSPPGLARLP